MNTQQKIYYPTVATDVMEILKHQGFFPKIVGYGPLPSLPRYERGFLIDPTTEVHPYAKRGVEALVHSQMPIQGYIMIHELEFIVTDEPKNQDFKIKSPNILPAVSTGAAIFATLALGILAVFFQVLTSVDPAFVVVLDDDLKTWVEIVCWNE
jgi:hypothetical protein